MPRFYHVTKTANLPSIQEHGLLVAKADPSARLKAVWVCTATLRAWAILHTQQKHKVALDDISVIELKNIAKERLVKFKQGLHYSKTDIGPEKISVVIPGAQFGMGASH